ncbi:hypothetical protein ACS0TY_013528 [Phlomoides rotata]
MAKKKHSHAHQEKPSQKQEDSVKAGGEITPSMDSEALEKLESLKSLNQMLIKEAFERRQQVESLVQSRGSLESEVARSNSEKEALRSELTRLGEKAASLELEQSVVAVFVAVQVGLKGEEFEQKLKGLEMEKREMKLGISEKEMEIRRLNCKLSEIEDALVNEREVSWRVCVERDDFGDKLSRQIEEGKGLKEKLLEFGDVKREIDELRASYNAAVGEKVDMGMEMESLMGEKDSVERGLVEANTLIERLKEQLCGIVKEKEGIEDEKKVEKIKNQQLENALSGLNEIVADLQKEEAKLRTTVAELEKKFSQGEGRQKEMGREIDELVEEKQSSKKRIQRLMDEKTAIEKGLSESVRKLAEQEDKIQLLVDEKNDITEAKGIVDNEVGELQNKVAELKAVVLKLEERNRVGLEKIKSLESEVGEYNFKLEEANVERGGMERSLKAEKENVARLKEKMSELESKIKESYRMLEQVKAEKGEIFDEKMEAESRCEMLKMEVASLQKAMDEGRKELKSMKDKVELADTKSELVLKMVKDTAAFCLKEGGEFVDNGGEEEKEYAMELEVIKKAFKLRDGKVEEMKKELELLEEDAKKKRSFWTVVSSATTVLAAVSVAYVARGGH